MRAIHSPYSLFLAFFTLLVCQFGCKPTQAEMNADLSCHSHWTSKPNFTMCSVTGSVGFLKIACYFLNDNIISII